MSGESDIDHDPLFVGEDDYNAFSTLIFAQNYTALIFAQDYVNDYSSNHGQSSFELDSEFNLVIEGDDVSGVPLEGDLDTMFTLFAYDGLLRDSLEINVYVNPVNDMPMITSHDIDTAYVDDYFVYYPFATEPEDSTLIWGLLSAPQWMIIAGDSLYGLVPRGSDDTTFTVLVSD